MDVSYLAPFPSSLLSPPEIGHETEFSPHASQLDCSTIYCHKQIQLPVLLCTDGLRKCLVPSVNED